MLVTLWFIAGIIAGIVLVTIALTGWITASAHRLTERHARGASSAGPAALDTGRPPVAGHRADHRRGRHRAVAAAA